MTTAEKAAELVLNALEAHAAEQGLDIVSVEVGGPASHPTLRVRVDLLEGGPIDMDAVCAHTAWVSEVVDGVDPFSGAYELEVSSPGIDRPLRRPADFERFCGETVEFHCAKPVEGRKVWTGVLKGLEEGRVLLEGDGEQVALDLADMKRCNIKPDFEAIMAAAKKAAKQLEEQAGGEDDGDDDAE